MPSWSHHRLLLDSLIHSSLHLGHSLFQKEMTSDLVRLSCLVPTPLAAVIGIASMFDLGHLRMTLRLMDDLFCFCGPSYWFQWSYLSLVGLSFVEGRWTYHCWEPPIAPRRYLYNNLISQSLVTCHLFVSAICASARRSVVSAYMSDTRTCLSVRYLNVQLPSTFDIFETLSMATMFSTLTRRLLCGRALAFYQP